MYLLSKKAEAGGKAAGDVAAVEAGMGAMKLRLPTSLALFLRKRLTSVPQIKYSPAEKAKHWQLLNPNGFPGARPTNQPNNKGGAASAVAAVSKLTSAISSAMLQISEITDLAKCTTTANDGNDNDNDASEPA
jgi:hypothetical protein